MLEYYIVLLPLRPAHDRALTCSASIEDQHMIELNLCPASDEDQRMLEL